MPLGGDAVPFVPDYQKIQVFLGQVHALPEAAAEIKKDRQLHISSRNAHDGPGFDMPAVNLIMFNAPRADGLRNSPGMEGFNQVRNVDRGHSHYTIQPLGSQEVKIVKPRVELRWIIGVDNHIGIQNERLWYLPIVASWSCGSVVYSWLLLFFARLWGYWLFQLRVRNLCRGRATDNNRSVVHIREKATDELQINVGLDRMAGSSADKQFNSVCTIDQEIDPDSRYIPW
ncbi:hypothetical protein B0H13DRAFT_1935963 [Mycena leptocephala]|nr:hypothetical protein B0H13DRAFT_1935963 [Mycena leptocephala]